MYRVALNNCTFRHDLLDTAACIQYQHVALCQACCKNLQEIAIVIVCVNHQCVRPPMLPIRVTHAANTYLLEQPIAAMEWGSSR